MKEVFRTYPLFERILSSFGTELRDHNFILPNLVEPQQTFTKGLGVQSDIVLKEMYKVVSPQGKDNGIVLRPEGTAPVLRALLGDKEVIRTVAK